MAVATVATEVGVSQGDAELLYSTLLPYRGTTPRFGQAGGHLGPVDRILALLAARCGLGDVAADHRGAAIDQARAMEAKPWIDRCSSPR
ncbi:MAG: hypothetical protein R2733_00185 [Acidimicrobiales bacterium]